MFDYTSYFVTVGLPNMIMADRNDEHLLPRASGGSGAPSFADFSSFREMIREEREAARAEREAAAAEA